MCLFRTGPMLGLWYFLKTKTTSVDTALPWVLGNTAVAKWITSVALIEWLLRKSKERQADRRLLPL